MTLECLLCGGEIERGDAGDVWSHVASDVAHNPVPKPTSLRLYNAGRRAGFEEAKRNLTPQQLQFQKDAVVLTKSQIRKAMKKATEAVGHGLSPDYQWSKQFLTLLGEVSE